MRRLLFDARDYKREAWSHKDDSPQSPTGHPAQSSQRRFGHKEGHDGLLDLPQADVEQP
jgi:hypothetical protein